MSNSLEHEIELYPFESFNTLLAHEVNRSRRYGQPLTLLHLIVETNPVTPQNQHSAEVFMIDILNVRLRETDIPCKKNNEFLILMPSTDEQGGRIACERLEELLRTEPHLYDKVSFELAAYIGMATSSGDRLLSSNTLLHNAAQALGHAREHRLAKAILFSEIGR